MTQARNLSRLLNKKMNTFKYTATAGQTSFADSDDAGLVLSYAPDNLMVTYNGVVLENGSEYTASNGSSIVLSEAADSAAEVNVYAFETISYGGYLSTTTGGTVAGDIDITGRLLSRGNELVLSDGVSNYLKTADKLYLQTDATTHGALTNTGNLGLGTDAPTAKLHIDGGVGQQLIINSANTDPGININYNGTKYGYLFVDTSDGNTTDIEGANGVNVNGSGGVTIAEFTTGGNDLLLGRNKYKGTQTHETFKWSYNRFSNANSTTTTATWLEATGSSFVFAPTRSDTKIRIIGDINAGMAWTNPSGTNHGNVIYRIKIVNGVGTFYTSEYTYWGRVDTFTGVLEHVANGVLEYHMSIANNNGSNITISVEYQRNVTAGSGFTRGGINTWAGTSLITVEEYLD